MTPLDPPTRPLPCPFCGTVAGSFQSKTHWRTVCMDISCAAMQVGPTRQASEESWNRRSGVALDGGTTHPDTARLDWLETMVVNVRKPMRFGSHNLFWSSPSGGDEEPIGPSDIREAIDKARKPVTPPHTDPLGWDGIK